MGKSEVAQIRQQIMTEYEAMQRGIEGLAYTAQHAFINARLQSVDRYHEQLSQYVGEEEATRTICELYTQIIG
ncbi:MAG TPA: hypothetical protein VL461_13130 [Dictyobacter sp.]|jgi:hypothetical protein|nr:hypothetical protein [Dictyobacter sp.]